MPARNSALLHPRPVVVACCAKADTWAAPRGYDRPVGNIGMKPVKLSELIDALESDSDEFATRVDLHTGAVVRVEHSLISAVEEGDEDYLDSLADWQKEEVEIAKAIVEDSDGRFVGAPSKFDFHEYRHMERFIGRVEDSAAAEQLWRAIKGKGAFRHFKDTAHRLGILKQWFAYRDNAMKEFVRDWAEAHQIPVVDDTHPNPLP
jgi:hypothetical protein